MTYSDNTQDVYYSVSTDEESTSEESKRYNSNILFESQNALTSEEKYKFRKRFWGFYISFVALICMFETLYINSLRTIIGAIFITLSISWLQVILFVTKIYKRYNLTSCCCNGNPNFLAIPFFFLAVPLFIWGVIFICYDDY
jgi:hypothetical protein